jgi:hypothetical protein
MLDNSNFDDNFLAPQHEIVALIAHLATGRSGRIRRGDILPPCANPETCAVRRVSGLAIRKLTHDVSPPNISVRFGDDLSWARRRKHCECGHCPRCVDNARWNRIFSEKKFADPAYYSLKVRHASSLVGGY